MQNTKETNEKHLLYKLRRAADSALSSTVPNDEATKAAAPPVVVLELAAPVVVPVPLELPVWVAEPEEDCEAEPEIVPGGLLMTLAVELLLPDADALPLAETEAEPLPLATNSGEVGGAGVPSAGFASAPLPHGLAEPSGCVAFGAATGLPSAVMEKRPVHSGLPVPVEVNW